MVKRFLSFEGGLITADTAATANAIVIRGTSGEITCNAFSATQITMSQAEIKTPAAAQTTGITLGVTPAPIIKCDATSAAFTIVLPAAATASGLVITFIKIDAVAHTVTIQGSSTELINGANTYTSLTAQYNKVTIWCDGTQWYVIA